MSRKDQQLVKEIMARQVLQEEITRLFGEEFIQAARERLCKRCVRFSCFLSPICSDGKDCPYFEEEVVEE